MCEAITNTNGNRVQYYNASCNIDRCGTIKLRYCKVNLWGDERKTFTKGDVHEVSQSKELGPLEEAEKLWDVRADINSEDWYSVRARSGGDKRRQLTLPLDQ
jgi:hypothetical protein